MRYAWVDGTADSRYVLGCVARCLGVRPRHVARQCDDYGHRTTRLGKLDAAVHKRGLPTRPLQNEESLRAMKKTKLTRSLLAACSIVALSAVMYGCHSSGPSQSDLDMAEADAAAAEAAAAAAAEAQAAAEAEAAAAATAQAEAEAEAAAADRGRPRRLSTKPPKPQRPRMAAETAAAEAEAQAAADLEATQAAAASAAMAAMEASTMADANGHECCGGNDGDAGDPADRCRFERRRDGWQRACRCGELRCHGRCGCGGGCGGGFRRRGGGGGRRCGGSRMAHGGGGPGGCRGGRNGWPPTMQKQRSQPR